MAWWFREYAHEQSAADRTAYESAEDAARITRRGLWQDARPVAPWEWRNKGPRSAIETAGSTLL